MFRHTTHAIGPIQLARRARTSIKALRYYERHGLIRPKRSASGWRMYEPSDVERLAQIQTFKQMGFGVAEIATLLEASPEALAASLCAQETRLLEQRDALEDSLRTLRRAQHEFQTVRAANEDTLIRAA